MDSASRASNRLSAATIGRLPPSIRRPGYDRSQLRPGILHLGVGAFHRCHQADYTDDALEASSGDWGIVGVNLKPPSVSAILNDQDGYYCRELRNNGQVERRLIGSIVETISVLDDGYDEHRLTLAHAIARAASPDIRLINMTVTEKGYCHIPATGELDENHPDIRHDIEHPERPRSVPGFLLRVLSLRFRAGLTPPLVMSCDNVPDNAGTLRRAVLGLADAVDPALGRRIGNEVRFLNTMVDRIVPASRVEYIDGLEAETGLRDYGLVTGEPFRMWVIETGEGAELPAWDAAGAIFVPDVQPYEILKMRVVNGIQSKVCQLGLLSGLEFMAEVMATETFSAFARQTISREVIPNLPHADGVDVGAYLDQTIGRLKNTDLKHGTLQISTDGSQKIRQRLLEPMRAGLRAGTPIGGLLLGVAGWMKYAAGRDWQGRALDVRDPFAAETVRIGDASSGDVNAVVTRFLDIAGIFGSDLKDDAGVKRRLATYLEALGKQPAIAVVADHLAGRFGM
jgi:fructuronate reductase